MQQARLGFKVRVALQAVKCERIVSQPAAEYGVDPPVDPSIEEGAT